MFRWITEVQPYHHLGSESDGVEEFHYMQRLVQFVDGGLKDWSFVHWLSGIVTQGCHCWWQRESIGDVGQGDCIVGGSRIACLAAVG